MKIVEIMNKIAPEELAESWDNCGMQINCDKKQIDKILISLEITDAVIDEAIENKVDFIITHHPLLFDNIKEVDINNVTGNYIFRLINGGISVYSAHTSFDIATGGNNDYIFNLLELKKSKKVENKDGEICRWGELKKPLELEEVCKMIEDQLKLTEFVRVVGDLKRIIKTVGVCTGAGGEFLEEAKEKGCDLFITGDLKHHQALWAKEAGIAVIDAGHYGTEWIFTPNMANQLRELMPETEILESKVNTDPFF